MTHVLNAIVIALVMASMIRNNHSSDLYLTIAAVLAAFGNAVVLFGGVDSTLDHSMRLLGVVTILLVAYDSYYPWATHTGHCHCQRCQDETDLAD